MYKVKCPVASVEPIVSVTALTKLYRSVRTTSAMVVLNSTTFSTADNVTLFTLATLPVRCCSTVFTDVTSLTSSPTLVTLLAKQTNIAVDYCWYVSLQRYETERCCAGSHYTHTFKLPTALLFDERNTTRALARPNSVILSARVLLEAVSVQLLKMISTEIAVCQCDAV